MVEIGRRTLLGLLASLPFANKVHCSETKKLPKADILPSISRIELKPCEYARMVVKCLRRRCITLQELAWKCGVSSIWLADRVNLVLLKREYQDLVDSGTVSVENGIIWSHVHEENQHLFMHSAKTMSSVKFRKLIRYYHLYGIDATIKLNQIFGKTYDS